MFLSFDEHQSWLFLVDNYSEVSELDSVYSIENNLTDNIKRSIFNDYNNELNKYFYITPSYMNIIDWIKANYPNKLRTIDSNNTSFYLYNLTNDEFNQLKNYYNNYIDNEKNIHQNSINYLIFHSDRNFYIPPHGIYVVDGISTPQHQVQNQEHCLLKSQNLFKVNKDSNLYFEHTTIENDYFYYHQNSNNEIVTLNCTTDNVKIIENNISRFFNQK
jgi:hypothetical protein